MKLSIPLVTRDMKLKPQWGPLQVVGYLLESNRKNNMCCGGCGETEPSYFAAGNVILSQPVWKAPRWPFKTINTELPHGPMNVLPGKYCKNCKSILQ
jgi:hypothetical protein